MDQKKYCNGCGENLQLSDFWGDRGKPDGKQTQCKRCRSAVRKEYYRKNSSREKSAMQVWREKNPILDKEIRLRAKFKKYGLTVEKYELACSEQGGLCAICGREPKNGILEVDHSHSSGVFRGLLCGNCNRALGLLNEDIDSMIGMIKYINSSPAEEEIPTRCAPGLVAH